MDKENKAEKPKAQADDHGIAIGEMNIGGDVSGSILIGNTGYTAQEVSVLISQITATFQPKPFDGSCPYKGLDVFEEEDAELFFGREKLVESLVDRVKESRILFVTGPSGSGKSSLVRAGLIPAWRGGAIKELHSEHWCFETMKPGRDPLEALRLCFSRLKSPELGNYLRAHVDETNILNECAESALSGRGDQRFVLFIDQFEEVFTQINREEERLRFLNVLTNAVTAENGRVILVLAMRSDFVSNCAAYPELNARLNQPSAFAQIGSMQPEELVSAIAQPALRVGLRVDPDLIAQIINDMQGEPGALPLMQFALKDLFDAQQAKGGLIALTLDGYIQQGGIRKALEHHADNAFARLSESEQTLAHSIFSGLIEIGRGAQDTRRTALFDELVPAEAKTAEVEAVVRKLADARLIITDEQAGRDTVTISHEKLIEAWPWLKKLVSENRDAIALQNEIAEDAKEWDDHRRDPSYLYSGVRLASAREQLDSKKIVLGGLAQVFIETGVKAYTDELVAARQRAARLRRQAFFLSGALVIALVAVGIAVFFSIQSQRQAEISRAGELVTQSIVLRDKSFPASLLLGVEALKIRNTVRTRGTLIDNLEAVPHPIASLPIDTGKVTSVAFSPDGKTLASGSDDYTILLWDISEGKPIGGPLRGHEYKVTSVAFSPNGKILASGSEDNTIILWNVDTGEIIGEPLRGHADVVTSVAFSPDGKTLASGSDDYTILLWDISEGKPVGEPLRGHEYKVTSVAFSPNGKILASGSRNSTIILWDTKTRQAIGVPLGGHTSPIGSIAFSPDGKKLASGDWGNTIILWDVETQLPEHDPLLGHTTSVESVTFSPDGKTLASGSWDGTVVLWDIQSGQPITTPLRGHTDRVSSVDFSPDGKTLASGGWDGAVVLWDTQTQLIRQEVNGHTADITEMITLSLDGKILALGSKDNSIIVWEVQSGKRIGQPLSERATLLSSAAFSPDGRTLALGSCEKLDPDQVCTRGKISLWDVKTGQPIAEPLHGHTSEVTSVTFSPDGKTLASGGRDNIIILWGLQIKQPIAHLLLGESGIVTALAFSPNGKWLASGDWYGPITLWDVKTREPIGQPLRGHTEVTSIAFSPDGKMLASNSTWSGTIILWDVQSEQPIGQPLNVGLFTVESVAFSRDGKTLASGSWDGTMILWDMDLSSWIQKTCERARRNFTRAEWAQYFPNEEYRATCPQWPSEPEPAAVSSPTP